MEKRTSSTVHAPEHEREVLDLVVFDRQFDEIVGGQCGEVYRPVSSFWKHRIRNRTYSEAHVRTNSDRNPRSRRFQIRGISETVPPGQRRAYYAIQLGPALEGTAECTHTPDES